MVVLGRVGANAHAFALALQFVKLFFVHAQTLLAHLAFGAARTLCPTDAIHSLGLWTVGPALHRKDWTRRISAMVAAIIAANFTVVTAVMVLFTDLIPKSTCVSATGLVFKGAWRPDVVDPAVVGVGPGVACPRVVCRSPGVSCPGVASVTPRVAVPLIIGIHAIGLVVNISISALSATRASVLRDKG
jgi:hypothetical protein